MALLGSKPNVSSSWEYRTFLASRRFRELNHCRRSTVVQKPLFARHKPLTVPAWNMMLGALGLAALLPSGMSQLAKASRSGI
jgi:hypothetical protein